MKAIFFTILSIFMFMFMGCATLFKSSYKTNIDVTSMPKQAKVYVNGHYRGSTPMKLNLSNNESYEVRIEKPGYSPTYYNIGKKVGVKWVILNVLAGAWPIMIDALTGNWYELDQEDISIELNKE